MTLNDRLMNWLDKQTAYAYSILAYTLKGDWHVEIHYRSGARIDTQAATLRQAVLEARLERERSRKVEAA
jgi:hypothetical protein